jgi:hypothetical protein
VKFTPVYKDLYGRSYSKPPPERSNFPTLPNGIRDDADILYDRIVEQRVAVRNTQWIARQQVINAVDELTRDNRVKLSNKELLRACIIVSLGVADLPSHVKGTTEQLAARIQELVVRPLPKRRDRIAGVTIRSPGRGSGL